MLNPFSPFKLRPVSFAIALAVLLLAPFSKLRAQGETVLDWAAFNEERKAESGIVGNLCFSHLDSDRIRLVNASTDPISPFSSGGTGFYFDIDATGDSQARIWIRTSTMDKKGWVEIPFQIVDGGFSVNFDFIPGSLEKLPSSFITLKPPLFMASVEVNKVRAGPEVLKTASGASVTQGTVHTLRIAWDTPDSTLQFEVFIDGDPLLSPSGDPVLKATGPSQGLNIISIKSKQKKPNKFFLGTVLASGQ